MINTHVWPALPTTVYQHAVETSPELSAPFFHLAGQSFSYFSYVSVCDTCLDREDVFPKLTSAVP